MLISIDQIREHIQNDILNDASISIGQDEDLLLSGLIDSLGVMRLVAFLEQQCDVTIPAEDVLIEHFGSLEQMHAYLTTRTV